MKLFAGNTEKAIDFLKQDCNAIQFVYLSEILDDIAQLSATPKLIQACKDLMKKFPQEAKDYHIDHFVQSAELYAQSAKKSQKHESPKH